MRYTSISARTGLTIHRSLRRLRAHRPSLRRVAPLLPDPKRPFRRRSLPIRPQALVDSIADALAPYADLLTAASSTILIILTASVAYSPLIEEPSDAIVTAASRLFLIALTANIANSAIKCYRAFRRRPATLAVPAAALTAIILATFYVSPPPPVSFYAGQTLTAAFAAAAALAAWSYLTHWHRRSKASTSNYSLFTNGPAP